MENSKQPWYVESEWPAGLNPELADKPGQWLACNDCARLADARPLVDTPVPVTTEVVLRFLHTRGWSGEDGDSILCPACTLKQLDAGVVIPPNEFPLPALTAEYAAVMDAAKAYSDAVACESENWELAKAAIDAAGKCLISWQQRGVQRAEVCPVLAIMQALGYEWMGIKYRVAVGFFAWLMRHVVLPGIPGWNDYEMMAWQLTRSTYYVRRIHKRLRDTRGMVQATCDWMVQSVRAQDPEFDKQWREVTA